MRLLNTTTLKLETFIGKPPPYVILSHTWGDEEVTFDDIHQPHARNMLGYKKIDACCRQAKSDGYQYAWIDTVAIDKKSSAELSESINSMYRYYQDADVCYAYLADVPSDDHTSFWQSNFRTSRWFTRGWTLQELLAPEHVEFYSSDWVMIGTKHELLAFVCHATGIMSRVIRHPSEIRNTSIAQRFSWISRRATTRTEDMAYCMMGICDVNMPLLYGEGHKAFIRLQEEIVKRSTDQTFLCWDPRFVTRGTLVDGAFCSSPEGFKCAGEIVSTAAHKASDCLVTNRGLRISVPYRPHPIFKDMVVVYPQAETIAGKRIAIQLQRLHDNQYQRTRDRLEFVSGPAESINQLPCKEIYVYETDKKHYVARNGPSLVRFSGFDSVNSEVQPLSIMLLVGSPPYPYRCSRYPYNPEGHTICRGGIIGFILGNGISTLLIAVGLSSDGTDFWVDMALNVQEETMQETLESMRVQARSPPNKRYRGCSSTVWVFGDNYSVFENWKKKRERDDSGAEFMYWHLEMSIRNTGEPGRVTNLNGKPVRVKTSRDRYWLGEAEFST